MSGPGDAPVENSESGFRAAFAEGAADRRDGKAKGGEHEDDRNNRSPVVIEEEGQPEVADHGQGVEKRFGHREGSICGDRRFVDG